MRDRMDPDADAIEPARGRPTMPTTTAPSILEREGDGFVVRCPALDVASQGDSAEEALANLEEVVSLFLKCADPAEVERRLLGEGSVPRSGPEAE